MMGHDKVWYCQKCRNAHLIAPDEDCDTAKLRAVNAAIAAMSEWQPIETAPKDGTPFLAWQNAERGPFKCWWRLDYYEQYWMDPEDSEPDPKFWYPLPTPPEAP